MDNHDGIARNQGTNCTGNWVKEHFLWTLEIVLRSDKSLGFILLPKRWIVERIEAQFPNDWAFLFPLEEICPP
jgi:hypothetical protein